MKKTITEMAEKYDITPETLRKWERDFELSIPRSENNSRYYRAPEVEILDYIVKLKAEGLTKKAIIKALGMSDAVADQRKEAADLVPLEHMTMADLKKSLEKAAERHQVALVDEFTKVMAEALAEQHNRYMERVEAIEREYNERLDAQDERQIKALEALERSQREFFEEMKAERGGFFSRLFGKSRD